MDKLSLGYITDVSDNLSNTSLNLKALKILKHKQYSKNLTLDCKNDR